MPRRALATYYAARWLSSNSACVVVLLRRSRTDESHNQDQGKEAEYPDHGHHYDGKIHPDTVRCEQKRQLGANCEVDEQAADAQLIQSLEPPVAGHHPRKHWVGDCEDGDEFEAKENQQLEERRHSVPQWLYPEQPGMGTRQRPERVTGTKRVSGAQRQPTCLPCCGDSHDREGDKAAWNQHGAEGRHCLTTGEGKSRGNELQSRLWLWPGV